jgi:hypothetical protein
MFFFNLSLFEFLTIFSALSGVVVALYLLDRSRRKVLAATLRFWNPAERPVESSSRRRIRQWPSLLLQLLSLLCLLLAIAQLRLGSPENLSRDHALILDTSSWMAARSRNNTLFNLARAQALAYIRAVPSSDRVMIIYADALATPATPFDSDRGNLERAIRNAPLSSAALDLRQALDFARGALRRSARRPGEIVFAGAGRVEAAEAAAIAVPTGFRMLPVTASTENVGLRKIGLRRSTAESGLWQVLVSVRNYGAQVRQTDLALQFAGAPVGARRLRLPPGAEQEAAFDLRTNAAGLLDARVRTDSDSFPNDDRAVLELPQLPPASVTVCSDNPAALRPLLDAHPGVSARYLSTSACTQIPDDAIAIYDQFVPASPAKARAIYLEPPTQRSPAVVRTTAANTRLQSWLASHPLAAGLRAQDLKLDSTLVFNPAAGDLRIAETAEGPVILARETRGARAVIFGFHPMRSQLRYELSVPLLFANVLRWLSPTSFHRQEVYAERVGAVSVPIEPGAAGAKVIAADGSALPYSISGSSLRFFSGSPGTVRVQTTEGEQVHSLVLPDVPDSVWQPQGSIRRGVPAARENAPLSRDIWHWLAIAGGLGLLLEWLWFSPASPRRAAPVIRRPASTAPVRRAS